MVCYSMSAKPPEPPRWKMFLLTWAAAFPIAALTYLVIGSELMKLGLVLRALCITGVLVASLTYVVMPVLTRLAARWLRPSARGRR